jgi:hypothetical protein
VKWEAIGKILTYFPKDLSGRCVGNGGKSKFGGFYSNLGERSKCSDGSGGDDKWLHFGGKLSN